MPGRERVIHLLIEPVTSDEAARQLRIENNPAGIATVAADATTAESAS